jgi:hypothetical protein
MKDVSNATAYALLLPQLMRAGREVGYAIAVHGSMARDLDIVAVPWTEEAVNAERLIMHLLAAVDGRLRNGARNDAGEWIRTPGSEPKPLPHGRLAWSLHVGHEGMYLDVSVMPLAPAAPISGSAPMNKEHVRLDAMPDDDPKGGATTP